MGSTSTVINELQWDVDADINGTSLCGYFNSGRPFTLTVAYLKAASGQDPTAAGDGYKVSVEFTGTFKGEPFSLYDYKGDDQIHIGGRPTLDVPGLELALTAAIEQVQPAEYTATRHYDETDGTSHGWPHSPKTVPELVEALEEFVDEHDLELVCGRRTRKTVAWVQQNTNPGPVKFWAQLRGVEEKADGLLRSSHGNGDTPDDAIADYARQISGKTLVVDAMDPEKRKEIVAPTWV